MLRRRALIDSFQFALSVRSNFRMMHTHKGDVGLLVRLILGQIQCVLLNPKIVMCFGGAKNPCQSP